MAKKGSKKGKKPGKGLVGQSQITKLVSNKDVKNAIAKIIATNAQGCVAREVKGAGKSGKSAAVKNMIVQKCAAETVLKLLK